MEKSGNNFAFIDCQNLHLAVVEQGWHIDWRRFRTYLKDSYGVLRAFAFIGYVSGNESIYTTLENAGFVVVLKPTLQIRKGGQRFVKGNVDAELVLHTMIEFHHYERAVIVSGDGDFHCLIKYLRQQQKLECLLIPDSKHYSALLREFSSSIAFMDIDRDRLKYEPTKRPH